VSEVWTRRAGRLAVLLCATALAPAAAAAGVKVDAGGSHTCAVKKSGRVACWGQDSDGQASPPGGTFRSVSAGSAHTCGVKESGRVACWGQDSDGQTDVPPSLG
jgi:alpha-tubulin suppressor-like RCC1 family protein